jgi:hypothetical protein
MHLEQASAKVAGHLCLIEQQHQLIDLTATALGRGRHELAHQGTSPITTKYEISR